MNDLSTQSISASLPVQGKACVLMFVKAPHPGNVKTRLGKTIGNERAAELYTYFAQDVLVTLCQLPVTPLIFFAPDDARLQIAEWLKGQQYYPQQGEELGDRMSYAFNCCFDLGYEQALIVGSDSPDLPLNYLQTALEQLEAGQVVLGPSEDGGYYALGFTAENYCPQVFQGIEWSTEKVRSQTLRILERHARPVYELPTWYDIDTLNELQRFYQQNQQGQQSQRF
ncbi:MAG: TIGR04282 family arsenosugar biosynthesis glycosyltransferase [Cyanobacteria bacterium P01_A01_bin.17]